MKALRQPQYTGIVWLVLRVWLGYEWLTSGIEKVFGADREVWVGAKAGTAVMGFLNGAIAKSSLNPKLDPAAAAHPAVQTWYAHLVQSVFLPNAVVFSYLVAFGEVLIGVALILGLFTHVAALMGMVMNFAYLLAGTTSTNPQLLLVAMLIVFVSGAAAGYYGLDYVVRPIERTLAQRTRQRFFPHPHAA